jgi:hypothetical protein
MVHRGQRPLRPLRTSFGCEPRHEAAPDGDRGPDAELCPIGPDERSPGAPIDPRSSAEPHPPAALKAPPTPTDAFGMTQTDVEMQSLVETAPAPGRFACPSCDSMLRVGAILCPHCDADLWTMAHGGPAPSREAQGDAVAETRPAAPAPLDGHAGRRSLIVAAAALGAKLLLALMGTVVDGSSWAWSLLGWVTTLMAAYAIYLARRAGGRMQDARDERPPIAATYGLILGVVGLAYVASTFITSSIDRVVGSLHP